MKFTAESWQVLAGETPNPVVAPAKRRHPRDGHGAPARWPP